MRASYSSPSYSLLARIGPSVVSFQDSSLTTVAHRAVRVLDSQLEQQLRDSRKSRVPVGTAARGA